MIRRAVPVDFENAQITYKNFEGREGRYNRAGDRNFSIVIDDSDLANKLAEDGWNIRIREPRNEGEKPDYTLPVTVSFREIPNIPPVEIYIYTNRSRRRLDEETVGDLDHMALESIDLTIRPRFWEDDNGNTRVKAYLKEMHVKPVESHWANKWNSMVCKEDEEFWEN